MRVTSTIVQYVLRDIVRSRWLLAYGGFFLALTEVLLRFGGAGSRSLLSLLSIVLFVIPLVTIVFATVYLHHSREFTELVATQPVRRRHLYIGLHLGVAIPLIGVFLAGLLPPFVWHRPGDGASWGTVLMLAVTGSLITAIFVAIAALIAVRIDDRVRALGVAIAAWLAGTVLYDGLVLLVATVFSDYPLEPTLLGLMLINPVDIARVVLLMQFDISALMGITGAVFRKTLGGGSGFAVALAALLAWIAAPAILAARRFERRDF